MGWTHLALINFIQIIIQVMTVSHQIAHWSFHFYIQTISVLCLDMPKEFWMKACYS